MTGRICINPVTRGDWTAYLLDRATGRELPIERTAWRGEAGRAKNEVSSATVVLDPEYATRFRREARRWVDDLLLRRDGSPQWVGPIHQITDDPDEGVTWRAQDRMALVMNRRWFHRTGVYSGDQANMMGVALDHADYADPVGLRRQPILTGRVVDMPVVAGDKVGAAIDGIGIDWVVVADVVRYGDVSIDAEAFLDSDGWGTDAQPTLVADGYDRLTHVCAVTTNNGRVFFPSADPYDRPPGSPFLADTIDVGDVSLGAARELARQAWLARQGDLSIVANDRTPITDQFPLSWDELVPGAVLLSTAQGRQLTARRVPVEIEGVSVDINDGVEGSIFTDVIERPGLDLTDADIRGLESLPGIEFPPSEVFPLDPLPDIDWTALGLDPAGEFEPGGLAAPFPGFEPIPFSPFGPDGVGGIDQPVIDPYADCPPEQCCDLCSGGGGGQACTNKRAWLCTTLREGDDTWYGLNGEAAPLSPRFAAQTADGGLVMHANIGQPSVQFYDPNDTADLTTGTLRYDIEVTTHWDYPGLSGVDSYCYFRFGDWNFRGMIVRPGFQVNPGPPLEPVYHALWNGLAPLSFVDASIDTDPSTVPGLTGHVRGRMVCEIDLATGDCEVWLGRPGGTLVSQGAKNLGTGGDAGSGFEFNWQYTGAYNLPAAYALSILNSAVVTLDGVDLLRADERALNSIIPRYVPGVELRSDVYNFGRYQLFGSEFDSWFAFSPNGAPLLMSGDGTGDDDPAWEGNQPLWADGPTLDQPAIAAANRIDPGLVEIINEQPNTWVLGSGGDAMIVYAIVDLADFDNIDNGWPRGLWPFGTTIG